MKMIYLIIIERDTRSLQTDFSLVESFSWKTTLNFGCPTALNDQIEVYYKVDRLLNGLLSLWVWQAQCRIDSRQHGFTHWYRADSILHKDEITEIWNILHVEIFSWKTIALYIQLIDLKDHLEVCLPCSRLLYSSKFKVVFHENDPIYKY